MYDVDSLVPMAHEGFCSSHVLENGQPQMKRTMDPKQTYASTKLLLLKSSFSFS